MPHKTQTILAHEEALRLSGARADDGRPLAHQVFFDADNWLVPDGYEPMLKAHAAYLAGHPELAAVISGHSYGTGSHRFFWLMGDRRAMAVRAALLKAGATRAQLLAQSQGAARPLIEMAGEDVGRYRRRVTIEYVRLDAVAAPPVPPEGSAQWWRSVMGGGIQLPADRLGARIS